MSADADQSTPRYQVVGGGTPTDEELAALVVALTPVAVPDDRPDTDRITGWLRASLFEGVGGPPVSSASEAADLR